MFKFPDNVKYRVFDKSFKASNGKYISKTKDTALLEIQENRDAVCEAMGGNKIAILHQVHGAEVLHINNETIIGQEPDADAAYTTEKGVILAIQTADCVPVLLSDKSGKVIGAAHCGWKGARKNILEELVTRMESEGGTKFMAVIGPSIHQESYEVNKEYFENFLEESIENARFFIPSEKPEHLMFDLPAYVKWKLSLLGISDIYHIYENTYTNAEKYPSYRRACHTKDPYKCNILSTIVMKP